MNEVQRAKIVLKILKKTYPKTPIPLKHRNIFTLLISVLLSAQCTDVNVNNVTKSIYPKYNKPEHFVKLGRKKIEKLIKNQVFILWGICWTLSNEWSSESQNSSKNTQSNLS